MRHIGETAGRSLDRAPAGPAVVGVADRGSRRAGSAGMPLRVLAARSGRLAGACLGPSRVWSRRPGSEPGSDRGADRAPAVPACGGLSGSRPGFAGTVGGDAGPLAGRRDHRVCSRPRPSSGCSTCSGAGTLARRTLSRLRRARRQPKKPRPCGAFPGPSGLRGRALCAALVGRALPRARSWATRSEFFFLNPPLGGTSRSPSTRSRFRRSRGCWLIPRRSASSIVAGLCDAGSERDLSERIRSGYSRSLRLLLLLDAAADRGRTRLSVRSLIQEVYGRNYAGVGGRRSGSS